MQKFIPLVSNNNNGVSKFDYIDATNWSVASEFVDRVLWGPTPISKSEMTAPYFTELRDSKQIKTADIEDYERTVIIHSVSDGLMPTMDNVQKTRYQFLVRCLIDIGLVARLHRLSRVTTFMDVPERKGASNVGNGDRKYSALFPSFNLAVCV